MSSIKGAEMVDNAIQIVHNGHFFFVACIVDALLRMNGPISKFSKGKSIAVDILQPRMNLLKDIIRIWLHL
jgi:hypothetical protein